LRELHYGFEEDRFCLRLDPFPDAVTDLGKFEFRITIQAAEEIIIIAKLERGKPVEFSIEQARICLLSPAQAAEVAFERILEVAVKKDIMQLRGVQKLRVGVALWHEGLPVDVLPAEGYLEVSLGEENAAWPIEPPI
jgi:hypothetical protein